jgi:hypothetical protein
LLERAAERRFNLITRGEALASGLTPAAIKHRVESGRWRPVRRGVYAVTGVPPSWEQTVYAAVLASGDGVLASHSTSGRLFLPAVDGSEIEVTGPRNRWVRRAGIIGHRSLLLVPEDRTSRLSIPCVATARTIVDLSGRLDAETLGRHVDDLLRRRLVRLSEVGRVAARLRLAPGRSLATVQAVLAARREGYDPGDSALEARYIRALDAAGIPLPRTRYWVRLGGRRYRLDLAYPEQRLAIEIDSWAYHRWRSAFDGDRAKRNDLVLDGWRVLQISDSLSDDEMVALTSAARLCSPPLDR